MTPAEVRALAVPEFLALLEYQEEYKRELKREQQRHRR